MMTNLCPILLTLAASMTLALAADPDVSKLPPASDAKGVTFTKDLKPVFEKSCLKCHSGDKPKGKFRVETRESILKGGEADKPVVVPGKSAQSPMVWFAADLVPEMEMPPLDKRDKFPALTKEQIGLLRAWIDQGAK